MGNGTKISQTIEPQDLPKFFRELADSIENGGSDAFPGSDNFKKFKISGKLEFGQLNIKAKFKSTDECEASCENGEHKASREPAMLKYKHLKKRMKSSFKLIFKMIHEGQMPLEEAVDSFLADSKLMVQYPGYGDEYYEEYTKTCAAFQAAYEEKDLAKMGETIDAIAHEKSRCHAKYD